MSKKSLYFYRSVVSLFFIIVASGSAYGQTITVAPGEHLVIDADTLASYVSVAAAGTLTVDNTLTVSGDVLVEAGGLVTHSPYPMNATNGLRMIVSGTFDLQGDIDVSKRGLRGARCDGNASDLGESYGAGGIVQSMVPASVGGSYGGLGGGATPIPVYGVVDLARPLRFGSGGGGFTGPGGGAGGNGGGIIDLTVGVLILTGAITADGEPFRHTAGGSGGSGGTILIEAGSVSGNGRISADGGTGFIGGHGADGTGAGGRIALQVDDPGYVPVNVHAKGASDAQHSETDLAAAGTVLVATGSDDEGTLIIDNGNSDSSKITPLIVGSNGLSGILVRSAGRLVVGGGYDDDAITVANRITTESSAVLEFLDNAYVTVAAGDSAVIATSASQIEISAGATVSIPSLVIRDQTTHVTSSVDLSFVGPQLRIDLDGWLTMAGSATLALDGLDSRNIVDGRLQVLSNARLTVLEARATVEPGVTFELDGEITGASGPLTEMTVAAGGVLAHSSYPTNPGVGLRLQVDGLLDVQGVVSASARGLRGGKRSDNPSFLGETYSGMSIVREVPEDQGASFGGVGGMSAVSRAYGTMTFSDVQQMGSGGGGYSGAGWGYGGNGGGIIDLRVGHLQVDGAIAANGGTNWTTNGGGGGSGGSISVEADSVSGSGTISASGGAGSGFSGSGAGGRIAIHLSAGDIDPAQCRALGSLGGGSAASAKGSGGSVHIESLEYPDGRVFIDNGTSPSSKTTPLLMLPSAFQDIFVEASSTLELVEPMQWVDGTIELNGSRLISPFDLTLSDGGGLAGTGHVDADVLNAGHLRPGAPIGNLNFDRSLTMFDAGTLEIGIEGRQEGTEYDQILSAGVVELAGNLAVSFGDSGFDPEHGDAFVVIDAASITGRFDTVDLPALPDPLEWYVRYGTDELILYVFDPIIVAADGTGEEPSIQAAVESVESAVALIVLLDGTFEGAANREIVFDGDPIFMKSHSGDPDLCVVDCDSLGRAFTISGDTTNVLIQDITIRNGLRNAGGGILVSDGASPELRNVVFEQNGATSGGGGLHLGPGVRPVLESCVFRYNASTSGGGGLHLAGAKALGDTVYITNCGFTGNVSHSGGGGLHLDGVDASIVGCEFTGNASHSGGGGLHLSGGGGLHLKSTTISDNSTAAETGNIGAGIHLADASNLVGSSVIVSFNDGGPGVGCDGTSNAELTCSDVYGNSGGDWGAGCLEDLSFGQGNLMEDPLFCARPTKYTLSSASPCVEDNNVECGQIGAYGIGCEPDAYTLTADADSTAFQTVLDTMMDGDVLVLEPGTYTGILDVVIPARNITIRSLAYTETGDSIPDPGSCVIDCAGQGRAFRVLGGRGIGPVLEGLQIRNGAADSLGGAVLCEPGARLKLERCILAGNTAEYGGAVAIESGSLELVNVTFDGNAATDGSAVWGGDGSTLLLRRTLITGGTGPAVSVPHLAAPPSCSDIWNNTSDWEGVLTGFDTVAVLGNLTVDPLYVGDRYLLADVSPCGAVPECGVIGAMPTESTYLSTDPDGEGTDPESMPRSLALLRPYPNPFNPSTSVVFDLPEPQHVRISVYDIAGRRVAQLIDGNLPAGRHLRVWSGCDDGGKRASSGIYFIRMEADAKILTRKLIMLK